MLDREPHSAAAPPLPPSAAEGMEPPDQRSLQPIVELLARARTRQVRLISLSTALLCLAALLLLAPMLFALGAAGLAWVRPLGVVLLVGDLLAFALLGPLRARWSIGTSRATAELLASRLSSPALRRGLVPAVELGRALEQGEPVDFSRELAAAHIESVAGAARTADLEQALPDRPVRRGLQLFGAAGALFLILLIAFSGPLGRGAAFLVARTKAPAIAERIAEPITGEIELTYVYPAYTGLPTRTVPDTNGEISAPRGTQVRLATRADRQTARAFVMLGESAVALQVRDGRDLSGELLVDQPGSYRFRFESERGHLLAEGPPIPIAVEADAAPGVQLVAPAADVEIDPKESVTVKFEADDDYGLSQLALVYKLPGSSKAERIVLQRDPQTPRRSSGEYLWDVVALGVMPGDKIAYYVEATDNDQVSGPKTGVSRTQYLKIYSAAEHHRRIIEQVEQDWEQLISLLADRLEGPDRAGDRSPETLDARAATDTRALTLAASLAERAAALRKEKAPDQLWRALVNVSTGLREKAQAVSDARGALGVWLRRGTTAASGPMRRFDRALAEEIAEEERDILYLETLLDQQRIQDLVALSKELASKRRELAAMLEQYRTAPDDATRQRLNAEIARLKERMSELLQRMSELSRTINDEHVNAEAMKELNDSAQMMDAFDKLQQMLNEGQVEEAMKEMEKLGQMLDDLQKNLEKASGEFRGGEFGELGKQLGEFARQLDQLERQQQQVHEQTQAVRQGYKQQLQQRLEQKGANFVERLRKQVAQAQAKLGEVTNSRKFFREADLKAAQDAVEDLDKALAVKDFDQAAQLAAKALGHARSLAEDLERQARESRYFPQAWQEQADELKRNAGSAQAAVPPLDEVRKELENLFPSASQTMSEADRQKMKALGEQEAQLQQKASELSQQMEQMNQQAPVFPPDAQQMMKQVGERMGQAQTELKGRNPTGASAEQRAALDQLGQIKKGLEQQSQGQQGQGQQIPWPWQGPGMPSGRGEGSGTDNPFDDKVQIPGADQYQVPEEYRKDILDAMKQSAPEKYKDQVKRYYEEIVK